MSQMKGEPEFQMVPDLHWSSQLETGDGRMDEIHVAFVEILTRLHATLSGSVSCS
jgi:hemerythrin